MMHLPVFKNSINIDLGHRVAYLLIYENTIEILAIRFSNIVKRSNTEGALFDGAAVSFWEQARGHRCDSNPEVSRIRVWKSNNLGLVCWSFVT